MNLKSVIFFSLFVFLATALYGQRGIKRTNYFQSYKDTNKEIGYALNASYLRYQDTYSPHIQLYYTNYFTPFFGVGIGAGTMYNNNQLNHSFTLDTHIRVYDNLFVVIKPGVHLKKVRNRSQFLYLIGFEANYKMDLRNNWVLGPVIQFDVMQDELNFMAGLTMAYRF